MTVSSAGVSLGQGADGDTLGDLTPTKGNVVVGNGTTWSVLGVGTNTHVLTADSAQTLGVKWAAAAAGVTDHGALTGLADDDHTQYVLVDGTRAMTGGLEIVTGSSGTTVNANADELTIEGSATAGLSILTPNSVAGRIYFGDADDNDVGQILYDHSVSGNKMSAVVNTYSVLEIKGGTNNNSGLWFKNGTAPTASPGYAVSFDVSSSSNFSVWRYYGSDAFVQENWWRNVGAGSEVNGQGFRHTWSYDTTTSILGATARIESTIEDTTNATSKTRIALYTEEGALIQRTFELNGYNATVGFGTLATTATSGFLWIPSCAGVPTGAPTAPYTNAAALVVDTTNSRLYVRVGSTWKYATLT